MVNDRSVSVDPDDDDVFDTEEDEDIDLDDDEPVRRRGAPTANVRNFRSDAATRVEAPAPRPAPGARVQREAQTSLIGSDTFEMPSLHFLSEPKNVAKDPSLSKDALEQNARLLEGVLEDFGVKGEIIHGAGAGAADRDALAILLAIERDAAADHDIGRVSHIVLAVKLVIGLQKGGLGAEGEQTQLFLREALEEPHGGQDADVVIQRHL